MKQREIKFKAWVKGKEMFGGNGRECYGFYMSNDGRCEWFVRIASRDGMIFDVSMEDVVLMQSTGLKDKNGKEIYESDLVRWDDLTCEIQWNGEFGWVMKDDREDWECPSLYAQELVDKKGYARVEVVGNKYE